MCMQIILNNREILINQENISVAQLLVLQKFSFKMLVIKINGQLVKREDHDTTVINNGDKVDVIHLMSGG